MRSIQGLAPRIRKAMSGMIEEEEETGKEPDEKQEVRLLDSCYKRMFRRNL